MNMYEVLLLFTRATRQGLWDLHLASLELILPYFFSHDLQNYARLMPEYIAQMKDLKASDPEIWEFFKQENFSVSKVVMHLTLLVQNIVLNSSIKI